MRLQGGYNKTIAHQPELLIVAFETSFLDGEENLPGNSLIPEPAREGMAPGIFLSGLGTDRLEIISLQVIHGKLESEGEGEIWARIFNHPAIEKLTDKISDGIRAQAASMSFCEAVKLPPSLLPSYT